MQERIEIEEKVQADREEPSTKVIRRIEKLRKVITQNAELLKKDEDWYYMLIITTYEKPRKLAHFDKIICYGHGLGFEANNLNEYTL